MYVNIFQIIIPIISFLDDLVTTVVTGGNSKCGLILWVPELWGQQTHLEQVLDLKYNQGRSGLSRG